MKPFNFPTPFEENLSNSCLFLSFLHFSLLLVFLTSPLFLPPLRILLFDFSVSSFFRYAPYLRPFFFFWSFTAFLSLCSYFLFRVALFSLMVYYSEIRHTSPFVTFFFASLGGLIDSSSYQLGALLDCSSDPHLQIEDFVLGDSSLGLVLGNLYLLLCQSLAWFTFVRGVLRRESMGIK